jgi:hypothetical protein
LIRLAVEMDADTPDQDQRFNQIALQTIGVDLAAFDKTAMIDPSKVVNLRLAMRAIDLSFGECNRPIQIS